MCKYLMSNGLRNDVRKIKSRSKLLAVAKRGCLSSFDIIESVISHRSYTCTYVCIFTLRTLG